MKGEDIVRGEKYEISFGTRGPSWSHNFEEGEIVIADKPDVNSAGTDWDNWRFTSLGGKDAWWVNISDVHPIYDNPTQKEIEQLFGIRPKPHCTTCTCHKTEEV